MKNLYKTITTIGLVGALSLTGCGREDQSVRPIEKNYARAVIEHPDRWGRTTLLDMDFDGKWDVYERVRFNGRNGSKEVCFKHGYGPAQSVDFEPKWVDAEFFLPYQ